MRKTLTDLTSLTRVAAQSQFRTVANAVEYESLSAYSPQNIAAWLSHVGISWFKPRHKFLSYTLPDTGVYRMEAVAKIALVADWGTGTNEAEKVAAQINKFAPDHSIHLGDVYYTGTEQEINENFLGVKTGKYEPVAFPHGTENTFALCGNHEMYTKGNAYYDVLLPAIGQKACYFCLENDYWRIIGIDTAWNSTGLDLGPFQPSCKMPEEVMSWLATLKLENEKRGLIVLSHYQPWSSFESWYSNAAKQLAQFIKKTVLWFWGHEHRMAIYKRYSVGGLTAHGRLIGHGGMPVQLKNPDNSKCYCSFTDLREYPNEEGLTVGYNGFVRLALYRESLVAEYVDLNGTVVITDLWTPGDLV
jgi:hypothetical protein